MKKMLVIVSFLFITFSLTSCKNDEQTVYITDENGEQVKVVLTPTEEREVVKNAVLYASQADYEEVKGLDASIYANANFKGKNEKETADFGVEGKFLASEEGANASFKAEYKITSEQEEANTEGMVSALAYYEANDEFLYTSVEYPGEDGTNVKEKYKYIIDNLMNDAEGVLPPTGFTMSSLASPIPGYTGDISQMVEIYYVFMPNSNLVISHVDNHKFTLQFQLSMKDFLKITNQESQFNLQNDFKLNLDLSFSIDDGRFVGFNFKTSDLAILQLTDKDSSMLEVASYNFEVGLEVSYKEVTITKLSDTEKEDYILAE